MTETDDTLDTPLPTEPNEDIIRCILNAQGPVVNFHGIKSTFKKLMKNVKMDEFSSHARLLSPDYGKFVSFRCGRSTIHKFFIKKPPSQMPGDLVPDLKRYTKRYYASLKAKVPLSTLLALRKLGHISEEVFSSTGIFSPLCLQETDTEVEEQGELGEPNEIEGNV